MTIFDHISLIILIRVEYDMIVNDKKQIIVIYNFKR